MGKQRNYRIYKPLRTFIRPAKLLSRISFNRLFFILAPAESAPYVLIEKHSNNAAG